MKGLIVVVAVLLFGCADLKTLENLELAALQSGDWSAVERREKNVARRKARQAISCPAGDIPVCVQRVRGQRCSCTSRDEIENMLRGF